MTPKKRPVVRKKAVVYRGQLTFWIKASSVRELLRKRASLFNIAEINRRTGYGTIISTAPEPPPPARKERRRK